MKGLMQCLSNCGKDCLPFLPRIAALDLRWNASLKFGWQCVRLYRLSDF